MEGTHKKDVLIVVLLGLLIWFGAALVRIENERYALLLDMCPRANNAALAVSDCATFGPGPTGRGT
jgi:hypothetical protein